MPNFFCRQAFTQREDSAMATRTPSKKKPMDKMKPTTKPVSKVRPAAAAVIEKPVSMAVSPLAAKPKESAKEREARERRREALQRMLLQKRHEILKEIEGSLGQSLTEDQQRRLESARDVGDQALMDLDRELGISLMEMRNRRRQAIDEALTRLNEGTYGICGSAASKSASGVWKPCPLQNSASSVRPKRNFWKRSKKKKSATRSSCPYRLTPALSS